MTDHHPLEPSADTMRALVEGALEHIVRHIDSLPEQDVSNVAGAAERSRALIEPLPPGGEAFDALLDELFERHVPLSYNTASPGYLAYIPGGGIFHAAVADLVAAAVNRYVGVWVATPAISQLEANVIRWFAEIVGFPASTRGYLSTGGSLANFSAVVTARRERAPEDLRQGRIYTSDQVHHSVLKAARLAGFEDGCVRSVPSDGRFRIRVDALAQAIREDRAAGLRPFLLVSSAGTTNTGAVDDLDALADLTAGEGLWHHVDGAYGAFFALTERGRTKLRGIERADSITLDPHKGLFMPYGIGCLLVRDGAALRRAHSSSSSYMPQMQDDAELIDFCEHSPELSRDFRGLRVWLPFKMFGVGPFRASLDEKLDLARWAAEELRRLDDIEIVAEPELSVVAFRYVPEGVEGEALNDLNRRFLERINTRQRVFLTSTMLGNRFVIRICVLSVRTHRDRMEMCLEDIRGALAEVAPNGA